MAKTERLPLKVLIADDHYLSRQIVFDVMRFYKVENVEIAVDGRDAHDKISKARSMGEPYDIIFLDWNMPVIEGIDVLKYFRAEANFPTTAFVMLTAESARGDVLDAIRAGATYYIIKPVSRDMIGKKFLEVVEWLRKKRSEPLKAVATDTP